MGQTLSDIHRRMYANKRLKGDTHEEAIKSFPKQIRKSVEEDINKTFIESHFGMSNSVFWGSMIAMFFIGLGLTIYLL